MERCKMCGEVVIHVDILGHCNDCSMAGPYEEKVLSVSDEKEKEIIEKYRSIFFNDLIRERVTNIQVYEDDEQEALSNALEFFLKYKPLIEKIEQIPSRTIKNMQIEDLVVMYHKTFDIKVSNLIHKNSMAYLTKKISERYELTNIYPKELFKIWDELKGKPVDLKEIEEV